MSEEDDEMTIQGVDEHWYRVKDIAERLHVNESTVRRWLESGELRGMRLPSGRGWRIRQSVVDEWFRRREELEERERGDE